MGDLKTQICEVLTVSSGLSAREIAQRMRRNGVDVSKRDLNPLLYRDALFENDGGRVPLWRLAMSVKSADDTFNLEVRGKVARARRARLDHEQQIVTDFKVGRRQLLDEEDIESALELIRDSGLDDSAERPRVRHALVNQREVAEAPPARQHSRPRHARETLEDLPQLSDSQTGRVSTPPFEVPDLDWHLDLRPWQKEAFHSWLAAGSVGICEAVTGTGKTHLGLEAVAQCVARGERATVLVPSVVLQTQWSARLAEFVKGVSIGTLGGGVAKDVEAAQVVIAVVPSATKRDLTLAGDGMSLLVADEVHRYGSKNWARALRQNYRQRLGLTATLERGGDEGVSEVLLPYFDGIVHRYLYDRATREAVVAPFDLIFLGAHMNFREASDYDELSRRITKACAVLIDAGAKPDMISRQLPALYSMGGEVSQAVELYKSATSQRRLLLADLSAKREALCSLYEVIGESDGSIIFTQSISTADDSADRLNQLGLSVAAAHSKGTPHSDRQELLNALRDKEIDAIAAPRILDEGVDIPNVDLGIVIGASSTRRQMIQRLGRIIRRKEDGRMARFVILFAVGTIEDPLLGGREDFMHEVEDAATNIFAFGNWDEGTIDDIWAREATPWDRQVSGSSSSKTIETRITHGDSVNWDNPIESATTHSDYSPYSRSGLIDMLKSEGHSETTATTAVDSLNLDWNEHAAWAAANYVDIESFSRSELLDQLLYEGFTESEATYGVSQVDLTEG